MDISKLHEPFKPNQVEWRIGSTTQDKKRGLALAYIDARAVMDRLDEVCGAANWQVRYPHADTKTCCEIGIHINTGDTNAQGWVWKSDGAGDTDVEGAKGAFSDAFKRAAVRWGIGRYLYDLPAVWVEIEARGRSYAIKKSEYAHLEATLPGSTGASKPKGDQELWHGPLKKTALKAAVMTITGQFREIEDHDQLMAYWNSKETIAVVDQLSRDLPAWFYGTENKDGLDAVFKKREAELGADAAEREAIQNPLGAG